MKRLLMVVTLVGVLSAPVMAGEMPGVNPKSVTGDVPTVGSTYVPGQIPTVRAGDMADVGSADESGSSLIMTVLLTIISFI
jgi:hypothetical protein